MRIRNKVVFKKKNLVLKFNQMNQNGAKVLRGNKPAGRKPVPPKPVTASQLDNDLDGYMRKTKGYLNTDLDAYMAQAHWIYIYWTTHSLSQGLNTKYLFLCLNNGKLSLHF